MAGKERVNTDAETVGEGKTGILGYEALRLKPQKL